MVRPKMKCPLPERWCSREYWARAPWFTRAALLLLSALEGEEGQGEKKKGASDDVSVLFFSFLSVLFFLFFLFFLSFLFFTVVFCCRRVRVGSPSEGLVRHARRRALVGRGAQEAALRAPRRGCQGAAQVVVRGVRRVPPGVPAVSHR